jgi:hypothetical protein
MRDSDSLRKWILAADLSWLPIAMILAWLLRYVAMCSHNHHAAHGAGPVPGVHNPSRTHPDQNQSAQHQRTEVNQGRP